MLKKLIYIWLVSQLFYTTYSYSYMEPIRVFVNVTPDRLIFALILIGYLITLLGKRVTAQKVNKIELLMVIFSAVCTISMIVSGANEDTSRGVNRWLSTLFCFLFIPFFMFHISSRIFTRKKDVLALITTISLIGIYLGITGIFEHYHIESLVYPSYIMDPSIGLHYDRARGPFLNSGINGRIMIFGFVSSVFLLVHYRAIKRALIASLILPVIISIYFTYTRGVWLGFVGAILPLLIYKWKGRKYIVIAIVLITIGVFSGSMAKLSTSGPTLFQKRQKTMYDRLNLMYTSIRMIEAKPLFGWGYGRFIFISERFFKPVKGIPLTGQDEGSHNTLLGLFAEIGLIGFVPYVLILFLLVKTARDLYKGVAKQDVFFRNFVILFFSAFASYFTTMQIGDVRWNLLQNSIIFLFAGILFALKNTTILDNGESDSDGQSSNLRLGFRHV